LIYIVCLVSPAQQLENIRNLKIYDYELKQWKAEEPVLGDPMEGDNQQQNQNTTENANAIQGNPNPNPSASETGQQQTAPKVERGGTCCEIAVYYV
jgi:hypothetical protein